MSKYLAFSLMVVTMIIGIIGGYAVSTQTPKPSNSMTKIAALNDIIPEANTQEAIYTDQSYLTDMIAHHEEAVAMSKRVLIHTSRKEIRVLATNIIEAQTAEIVQMKQWLADWQ